MKKEFWIARDKNTKGKEVFFFTEEPFHAESGSGRFGFIAEGMKPPCGKYVGGREEAFQFLNPGDKLKLVPEEVNWVRTEDELPAAPNEFSKWATASNSVIFSVRGETYLGIYVQGKGTNNYKAFQDGDWEEDIEDVEAWAYYELPKYHK